MSDSELDPLRIAAAVGGAVLLDADGRVQVLEHDPCAQHPRVAGILLTPAALDVIEVVAVACREHDLTVDELLRRARAALAAWPERDGAS